MSKITNVTALLAALKTSEDALKDAARAIEPSPMGMSIDGDITNDEWCEIQQRLARIAIRAMESLANAEPDSLPEMEVAIAGLTRDFKPGQIIR